MSGHDTAERPFGAFAPTGLDAWIVRITRRASPGWGGKRLAFVLRRLVLRRRPGPVDVEVFGARMRLHLHDNIAERRVVFTPQYFDPVERETLAAFLKPGDVFIDVGANAGVYSLFAAGRVGPAGRIVAVEADPIMFARLKGNVALNPHAPILPVNVAAAGEPGMLTLYINERNRGQNSLVVATGTGIEVPAEPLLAILGRAGVARVDALKIDVEGAEYGVLAPFLRDAPPELRPRLVIAENNFAAPAQDLGRLLTGHGYREMARSKGNRLFRLTGGA